MKALTGGWQVPELLRRTLHSDSADLTSMIKVKLKRGHWVCASCNDPFIQPVLIVCNFLWGDSQLEIIVVISLEVLIFTGTWWIQRSWLGPATILADLLSLARLFWSDVWPCQCVLGIQALSGFCHSSQRCWCTHSFRGTLSTVGRRL